MNEAKANLCACGKHIMRFQREPGVWVMEADEHGDKHGFEECPPDAKDQLLMQRISREISLALEAYMKARPVNARETKEEREIASMAEYIALRYLSESAAERSDEKAMATIEKFYQAWKFDADRVLKKGNAHA